jgi:hypothetical protein
MLQQLIKPITSNQTPECEKKSGVYKIICNTCQKSYVGQTNWNLKSRFRECIHYIKIMNHTQLMHYTYSTADINIVTSMTPWHQSSKLTTHLFCFLMNKCPYSHSTIIMNSFPNNTRTSKIPRFNSYITNTVCHNPYDV